jgi:hypothetical protein
LSLLAFVFGAHFLFHVAATFFKGILIFCHDGFLGVGGTARRGGRTLS